ncbi:MAG TPA: hypothetical protein VGS03_11370 [Candidatus Polarisedimenticolia bacterium]|nr:hypothetical protein [Candidatus Polarisedimenticolia bacterium]
MSKRSRPAGVALLVALLVASGVSLPHAEAPAGGTLGAKAALEQLKELAGTWEGTIPSPEGVATRSVFAVTAGGTAVMETQFPGTDQEMLTLYFLDGQTLRATHYCSAGNQPHMKLDTRASAPGDLRFAFDGGTNFDPKKDLHIHSVRYVFGADGSLREEWEYRDEGKTSGTHKVTLTRKSS